MCRVGCGGPKAGPGEMAQQVEALAVKQDSLSLISGTHGMKPHDERGENQLQAVFLGWGGAGGSADVQAGKW